MLFVGLMCDNNGGVKMAISVWSLDDGYSDNKMYTGKRHLEPIPSHATHWRPMPENDLNENKKPDPFSHIGVTINNEKWLVGLGAVQQDMTLEWNGGRNKHADRNFPIILKTCLGLMAEIPNPVVEPLVMGLPVEYDEESRKEHLRGHVLGSHKVEIELANGVLFEREIYVRDLVVKKQPFLSFCDIILDRKGEVKENIIASQFNVVIDIGGGTANIYTIDNLDPISDLCDTTHHGMFRAYKWVGDYVESKLGSKIPSGKLPYIMKKRLVKGLDLTPAINKAYETLSNEIVRVVETMFKDSWAFIDRIIITGGGAVLLKAWLENAFQGKQVQFLGQHNTAIGAYKYGLFYMTKIKKTVLMSVAGSTTFLVAGSGEKST